METKQLLCLILFIGIASHISADEIVYDNQAGGPSGIDNLYGADLQASLNIAAAMTTDQDIDFDGIRFTGAYYVGNTPKPSDQFVLNVFNSAGQPASNLGSWLLTNVQRSLTPHTITLLNLDVYQFSAELPEQFSLNANQEYWFSISNTATGGDTFGWGALTGGNAASSDGSFTYWNSEDLTMDFQLTQSIPEPSASLMFLVLGLLGSFPRRAGRNLKATSS